MIISEELVSVYMELKKLHKWSDEFFITMLSRCNVPRSAIATYFDLCVFRKEMTPLDKMENIEKIREQVMKTTLSKADRLQLGKAIAFLEQITVIV